MVSYYITPIPPEEWETATSDLKIDPEWYRRRLLERWPDVEFYIPLTDGYLLEWGWPVSAGGGIAGLQKEYSVVSINDPHEEFFLWHRKVIPSRDKLYLSNASSFDSLELKPETTWEDIERFVGRAPNR